MEETADTKAEDRLFFPDVFPDGAPSASTSNDPHSLTSPIMRRSKDSRYRTAEVLRRSTNSSQSQTPSSCSCPLESQHVGKELLNTVLALPIDAVFTLLFVQEQFMADVFTAKKTTDVTATSWQERDDGVKIRQMTYTMLLPPSNLGPKVSYVTENQVLLPQSCPGNVYVVECEVLNTGIPYSDTFTVIKHYCITRQADGTTSVVSWVSVRYKKSVWGIVKNMIEKNTYLGVDLIFQEMASQLQSESDRISKPSLGKKRRRAATTAGKVSSSKSLSQGTAGGKRTPKPVTPESQPRRKWAWVTIVIAIISLAFGNAFIYNKLFRLEEMAALEYQKSVISSARYLGTDISWESVARMLHRQQELHDQQLELWRSRITEASKSLQETQENLLSMMESIKNYEKEVQAVVQEQSDQVKAQWTKGEAWREERMDYIAQMDFSTQSPSVNTENQQRDTKYTNDSNKASVSDN